MINWTEVGEKLRESRKAWGFTQTQVADYLGISQGQIVKLEKGSRKIRKASMLEKICLLYRIDDEWLLYDKGDSGLKPFKICKIN